MRKIIISIGIGALLISQNYSNNLYSQASIISSNEQQVISDLEGNEDTPAAGFGFLSSGMAALYLRAYIGTTYMMNSGSDFEMAIINPDKVFKENFN
ncbi:MAG: hypothetical protein ACK43K_11520, partial [Chitinophagales bacterium]